VRYIARELIPLIFELAKLLDPTKLAYNKLTYLLIYFLLIG